MNTHLVALEEAALETVSGGYDYGKLELDFDFDVDIIVNKNVVQIKDNKIFANGDVVFQVSQEINV